jgi:dTDP-4-amino-4,6-dideoxygalactose transaminase
MYRIPLIQPYITDDIKARVCAVLDSGYLTEGPVTRELESAFRQYTGAAHAIAACNCTVGLEMALRALGVGPGDEVIVPDYTYPATASVAAIVGAKIVIVDVSPDTMLIDYDALEAAITPRTKAIIPVSIFGNPLDYGRLNDIKARHGVPIVEDAACSIGARYRDKPVGNWADISVFSFHPRKFITTGEGGIITTNHARWAEWMESYKHFGMGPSATREGTVFAMIGTNYKLSNIQAAVGVGQMLEVDRLLERRRKLAARYGEKLAGASGVRLPETTSGGIHSYQSCCVFVERRDQIMAAMRQSGIEVQIGTYALHHHPAFQQGAGCRWAGKLGNSDKVFQECLALPLFHELTENDQDAVVKELLKAIRT